MSSFTYIRAWCPECFEYTAFRRYGGEHTDNAKIECSNHGLGKRAVPIDWVQAAIDATGHR